MTRRLKIQKTWTVRCVDYELVNDVPKSITKHKLAVKTSKGWFVHYHPFDTFSKVMDFRKRVRDEGFMNPEHYQPF